MKWKIIPMQRNPLKGRLIKIHGRKKKVRPANIITRDQWIVLTTTVELCSHVRTMIFIAMLLGFRASEILGLRWDDFDMKQRVMRIQRSQVGQHTGDTKTDASEEELPIHEDLFEILETWRKEQTHRRSKHPRQWMAVRQCHHWASVLAWDAAERPSHPGR
jgi:integrase